MYSTAAEVIAFAGIRPTDFGLADDPFPDENDEDQTQLTADAKLVTLVEGWLEEIADFINMDRGYTESSVIPLGVIGIAKRAACNMAAVAIMRRGTSVMRVDDYSIMTSSDEVFTPTLLTELRRYPKSAPRWHMRVAYNRDYIRVEDTL